MNNGPDYKHILDHSLVGVYQSKLSGEVVYMNKALLDILEYDTLEEFNACGGAPAAYKNPQDRKKLVEDIKKTGHVDGREFEFITKTGKTKYVFLYMYLEDGILSGTIVDFSAYKNIQLKLEQIQEVFQQLFEHMPSAVAIYQAVDGGNDFIFLDFNPAAEKIENVIKKEIIGDSVTKIFPGVKEFGLFEVLQRVWKTGKGEYFPVKFYKDESGHAGWRENWIYRLPGGEIVAIYNDASEKMKAEEKIKENLRYFEVFYKASIGREERILELKENIKKLEEKLNKSNG